MSIHGTKSKGRHPNTKKNKRERYVVGHVVVEICDHSTNGVTFALRAERDELLPSPPALFSGHVPKTMAFDLRKLANRLDELADKL